MQEERSQPRQASKFGSGWVGSVVLLAPCVTSDRGAKTMHVIIIIRQPVIIS